MIISYQYLNKHFFAGMLPEADDIYAQLTSAGLEGEAIVHTSNRLKNILLAEVVQVERLVDKPLVHVRLTMGNNQFEVVSGDLTLTMGEHVAFATVGACVQGETITVRNIAGITSQGMLVSQAELGLGGNKNQVWRLHGKSGQAIHELIDPDTLLTFGITPNRGDCLSYLGIARELSALTKQAMAYPPLQTLPTDKATKSIRLYDPDAVLYLGVWFSLETVAKILPPSLTHILTISDIRTINPLVDLTNFIMLELGQPMHVFDADTIVGDVVVRAANPGETLITLDGTTCTLNNHELVIADAKGPIALAGVIGGQRTQVTEKTRHVLLEVAHFTPARIMRNRRPHGLSTQSSLRFERGVDPAGLERAAQRFFDLLTASQTTYTITNLTRVGNMPMPVKVRWNYERAQQLLGKLPDPAHVLAILNSLGLAATKNPDDLLAPSWRFDLTHWTDLAEEIARIWGYQNITPTLPSAQLLPVTKHAFADLRKFALDFFVHAGCYQGIHLSFAEKQTAQILLANPLGEQTAALKTNLAETLISIVGSNHRRQVYQVKLVEIAKVFRPMQPVPDEHWHLGIILSGAAELTHWQQGRPLDLFDMKGLLTSFFEAIGLTNLTWRKGTQKLCHPTRQSSIYCINDELGFCGQVHPLVAEQHDLAAQTIVAEINLSTLWQLLQQPVKQTFKALAKFPSSLRDLAFLIDKNVTLASIYHVMRSAAGPQLVDTELFDVYQGKGIADGYHSLAFRLTFQDIQQTLSHELVDHAIARIVSAMQEAHNAILRG